MLKIGEFSSLAQVSVRTLRHYDELGLLAPLHVDNATGYRYYSVSQLPRLYRILALRDLGFPLDRIAHALDEGISADALRGMLLLRRVEQEGHVQQETERLGRLKALLQLVEQEGQMQSDVILKDLAPQWIVSLRDRIPAYRTAGTLFGRLFAALGPLGALENAGPGIALLHDTEYREQDVDVEAGLCLPQPIKEQPVKDRSLLPAPLADLPEPLRDLPAPLRCYELPPVTAASIVHHGAFNRIGAAYGGLLRWIEANHYRPSGPTRELFLHITAPATRDDESYVTEIQVPVTKN